MKKIVATILAVLMLASVLSACSSGNTDTKQETGGNSQVSTVPTSDGKTFKIGSTWWDLGTHGVVGDAAETSKLAGQSIGFDVAFNSGALEISGEAAITAVEDLIAAGCDGIVVINYSESCLVQIAKLCEENGVYFAQQYRTINSEEVAAQVLGNPYYVGRVHEDEYGTAYKLAAEMAENGATHVALISTNHGDVTNEARAQGYRDACEAFGIEILTEEWNTATADLTDYATNVIMTYPELDGFLLNDCSFVPYVATAAENLGKTADDIIMVATDFGDDVYDYLANGMLCAAAGGHHCDTSFAMLLVYNALNGAYNSSDFPIDILNNMFIVTSAEEYDEFKNLVTGWDVDFENGQAFNAEEFRNLAVTFNPDAKWEDIAQAAANLTLEDVKTRHAK